EERRVAVRGHYYEYPGMDGEKGEIWCYTDRLAYAPGDTVRMFVSATVSAYSLEIGRDGARYVVVLRQDGLASRWQDTPDQCSVTGCGWEASHEFTTGDDWPSGGYRITLTA